MELQSQTHQESQVSCKDELDANMNETGAVNMTLNTDAQLVLRDSVCNDTNTGLSRTATSGSVSPELQAAVVEHSSYCKEGVAHSHRHGNDESNLSSATSETVGMVKSAIKDLISSAAHSEEVNSGGSSQNCEGHSFTSNLTININNDNKSDSSILASPSVSSASRGVTESPMPSPASSMASGNDVSSSKSLTGEQKIRGKRRRRGSAWTDDETEYLLEIWAKQTEIMKEQGSEESVTSAPVYRLISRSLAEFGWEKTWEQCKTRIHTLKRAYKITKDEIDGGSQTVTYCRHFDKLEIISRDNPHVTPGMLAQSLEQKRKERGTHLKGKKIPVRRKLTVGENPNLVKRANISNFESFVNGANNQIQVSSGFPDATGSLQDDSVSNTSWYSQIQAQSLHQTPQQTPAISAQSHQNISSGIVSSSLPPAPQYPYSTATPSVPPPPYTSPAEVNNNKVNVKTERDETSPSSAGHYVPPYSQWSTNSTHGSVLQAVLSQPTSTGNDLERMRLDLEMRKLEVERNKIEMEERQRREDRDHQYRMMQLLLFGLGQQNISQLLSGQSGSEMAHAHSTDLLRALENGLVPGGSQKANEKGLSFSEL